MGPQSPSDKLAKDLRAARISHQREFFIPLSELNRLITASVIEEVILGGNPSMKPADARMYAERTEQSSKKLFAVLSYKRNGIAICSLLDSKLTDKDLPFKKGGDGWLLW